MPLKHIHNWLNECDIDIQDSEAAPEIDKITYKMWEMINSSIEMLLDMLRQKDSYTAIHQQRVAYFAKNIADHTNLSKASKAGLFLAGMVHDIGKIAISREILSKRELTTNEFEEIKYHPIIGHNILKKIDLPWPVADIILQHHERIDGSGYPYGLKGDDILPEAKILAVADVIEAISYERPYREALGIKAALKEIENQKDILFDPATVEASLKFFNNGYKKKCVSLTTTRDVQKILQTYPPYVLDEQNRRVLG